MNFLQPKRNRYLECIATGQTPSQWLNTPDRKKPRGAPHVLKGSEYSLPAPYNKSIRGQREKKYVYDANVQYMRRVCRELVCIDVGRMGAGGFNMTGFPDAIGSCDGIAFYCEFKKPGGKVSSAQLSHLRSWQDDGHASIIVASPDGFFRWHKRERPIGFVCGMIPVY